LFFKNPKKVFISCYYSIFSMCIIYTCKKNRIATVDIQHGVQDYNHSAYGKWKNVPKEGYNVLPDEFYCYSEKESLVINEWIKQNKCMGHKVRIIGNLWLNKWNKNNNYTEKTLKYLNVLKKSYGEKKVALITLQDLNTFFDTAWFLNVIKKFSKEMLWMIRMHPCNKDLPEILNAFKSLDSVELNLATNLPLPILIKFADIHITAYSTCVEDFANFKKKSIIIHPKGKQYYNYLIERDDAVLALTEKDAVRAINTILFKENL